MKLSVVVGSPNSRKVMAVARHLQAPVELQYLDFFRGDLQSAAYRVLNPNAMVPTLADGDLVLWESNAINWYLAEGHPQAGLLPADRRGRAEVQRWLSWELAHFNRALGVLSFEAVAKPAFMQQPGDPHLIAWAGRELQRFAPVLDAAVKGREALVGPGVTIADYAMIHLEGFKDAVPFDWSPYPQLNAYVERMRQLPHWVATAPSSPQAVGRIPS